MNKWLKPCPVCLTSVDADEYIMATRWGQTRYQHRGTEVLDHFHPLCYSRIMKVLHDQVPTRA